MNNSLEVNYNNLYKEQILIPKIIVCFVQTSQNIIPRVFLSLPCCEDNLQLPKKLHFRYSDLLGSEYYQLSKILVENKKCNATLFKDVGKTSTPFRIKLEPDVYCEHKDLLNFRFFIRTK